MSFADASVPPPPSSGPGAPADAPGPRAAGLRRDGAVVGLGVALLSAAVVVSSLNARPGGDLDVSIYLVGVAATVVLLGLGLLGRSRSTDVDTVRTLASWPLALGTVGAGLMVGVALDDGSSTAYVAGVVVLALAAVSYLATPSAPPVVAGVLGLLLVYGQAFSDVADFDVAEQNGFKTFAVAVLVFVVLASAAGWFLEPARSVVPVVVGAGAVLAYLGVFAAIALTGLFGGFAASFDEEEPTMPGYDGDVYLVLAFTALLVVGWLLLAYVTDAPGYRVLALAAATTVYPAGLALLAVERPTLWAGVVGVLGALALVAATLAPRSPLAKK